MKLGVDIEPFAALNAICHSQYSDLSYYAMSLDLAGCDSITVRIRSERDFITNNDFRKLRELYKGYLVLKIPLDEDLIKFCITYKPDAVIIYNEDKEKRNHNFGFNIEAKKDVLEDMKFRLLDAGIATFISIEPDVKEVKAANRVGVAGVELLTDKFGLAKNDFQYSEALDEINLAATAAQKLNLTVLANGNLNSSNIRSLKRIRSIDEVILGRSLLAKSSLIGIDKAVNEVKKILDR